MKIKNKKLFFSSIAALLFSIGVLFIALKINQGGIQKVTNESATERAKTRAEIVARKLIKDGFKVKKFVESIPNRGLASESEVVAIEEVTDSGQVARDPWGFPFSYKKFNDGVIIWSMGPNHVLDTKEEMLKVKIMEPHLFF